MDYATTIKKLVNILKSKNSDQLNEIESLWDVVNSNNLNSNTIVEVTPDNTITTAKNQATNLKRSVSELQQIRTIPMTIDNDNGDVASSTNIDEYVIEMGLTCDICK